MRIRQILCDREDTSFLRVGAVRRYSAASEIKCSISSSVETRCSTAPANCVVPEESSSTGKGSLELSKSKAAFPARSKMVIWIFRCVRAASSNNAVAASLCSWLTVNVLPEPVCP